MAELKADLHVFIGSDGTIMAYNGDGTLNTLFTDTVSYRILRKIYKLHTAETKIKKDIPSNLKLHSVKYFFRNTLTGEQIEIPVSHIANMITCLR